MSANAVGEEGIVALAKALETNARLARLRMTKTWSVNNGAALSRALVTNTTLQKLELGFAPMRTAVARAFQAAHAKRRVVALRSALIVRGETAARHLVERDGDHAVAVRVLGFLVE